MRSLILYFSFYLQGKYGDLACSKFGSRTFDAVWKYASDKKKNIIKNELKTHLEKIRYICFCGNFL